MKTIVIVLIELYRAGVSPYKINCCRFIPSCSEYAIQAIHKHGLARGLVLTIRRILKCHPMGTSGYDPVL